MLMKQALLIMDMQVGIVERVGDHGRDLLDHEARAIAAARGAGVPVIYVRVAFRDGYPEVSQRNRTFSALAGAHGFTEQDAATQIHPEVAPQPGEVIVLKRRVSAFTGSDLSVVLSAAGVESLVLTGIATSGVVLSTLREAADRDFDLVVLADACGDADGEVHRVLTEKVFPRQAEVTTVAEWAAGLGAATPGGG
jgi:nicotinamidase-related amidase